TARAERLTAKNHYGNHDDRAQKAANDKAGQSSKCPQDGRYISVRFSHVLTTRRESSRHTTTRTSRALLPISHHRLPDTRIAKSLHTCYEPDTPMATQC